MSSISYVSQQFYELAKVVEQVNEAILVFKRQVLQSDNEMLGKYPWLSVSKEEVSKSKAILIDFLKQLQIVLNQEVVGIQSKDRIALNGLVSIEELKAIETQLQANKTLTEQQFLILDTLVSVRDREQNNLFHKLRSIFG